MAKYFNILNRYAHIQRYRQILFVLLKHGFDDFVQRLRVYDYLKLGPVAFFTKSKKPAPKLISPVSIRLALEELGPTFVKMGQALASRTDLLPDDVLEELVKLQDDVPSFDSDKARTIIEKEFGKPVDELFESFQSKALAAGSIGQVHEAYLKTGERVVVKLRRPGIRREVDIDLEIMAHLAELMERHIEVGQVQKPTGVVAEFSKTIRQEMNFRIEAANIHRFAHQFRKEKRLLVPEVFRDLCSERVLTMAFVEGIKPSGPQVLRDFGIDPAEMAHEGAELVVNQIFIHGFYHADPHPGNIRVLQDGRICFLDFGMMGRLDRSSREWFTDLFLTVISKNEVKAADLLLRLTHGHNLVDRSALEREVLEMIDQYLYQPLKDLKIGHLLGDLFALTTRHELRIPPQFFLLIKAITQIENLGCQLDPEFDLPSQVKPFLKDIMMQRYNPKRFVRDLYESGTDLVYLAKEVPGELRELLKQTKRGKMRLEFEHVGLDPLRTTLDRVSSRIASAIVLASLIVGSSMIVVAKVPPYWHGIPVIGLGGYLMSAVMGLMLLRGIYRDRNR